jgi:hypothetical protein
MGCTAGNSEKVCPVFTAKMLDGVHGGQKMMKVESGNLPHTSLLANTLPAKSDCPSLRCGILSFGA